jgi:hypothetical protein
MFYLPIIILLFFAMSLGFFIYSNKMLINELKDDALENNIQIKNIIEAVNYNDKKLFQNQKYIHDVYEENNNFVQLSENSTKEDKAVINNSDQYYNMMKNYDALIRLTK